MNNFLPQGDGKPDECLSDKISICIKEHGHLHVPDIKESIQELKEWGDNNLGCIDDLEGCGECDMCKQHLGFRKEVDKIFGPRLTEATR